MGNVSLDIMDRYQHIYTEYAPMLIRFAEKFVSGFFAEDIVHDVFLKLWDKQVFRLPENDLKRVLRRAFHAKGFARSADEKSCRTA